MSSPLVTVVIPTLHADGHLLECLGSLERQSRKDFEVIVVDNSGAGLARARLAGRGAAAGVRIIENRRNVGFGAAINQGAAGTRAAFIAAINDDAAAHPGWIEAMLAAVEGSPRTGMCACQVRLLPGPGDGGVRLDSAGMLISGDGSSKQRGHGECPARFAEPGPALFPSGSAAMYRRAMLEAIGFFDEEFFLYCEDTDLGLRARRAGWECVYAPGAVVEHHYSHSAGASSALKAYYVERNRLFVLVKNFPLRLLWRAPASTAARYFWHLFFLLRRRGAAARFRQDASGASLGWIVVRAHLALVARLPRLWRERRRIGRQAELSPAEFARLLRRNWISPREVAAQ